MPGDCLILSTSPHCTLYELYLPTAFFALCLSQTLVAAWVSRNPVAQPLLEIRLLIDNFAPGSRDFRYFRMSQTLFGPVRLGDNLVRDTKVDFSENFLGIREY